MLTKIKVVLLLILFNSLLFAQNNKLDEILKNNKLKVCIWSQYYGISYIDSRTQQLKGIDSDLAVELAKDLNVELEYVQSSFPSLINDVNTNKCDIAMFAIGNTKSRAQKMRFTSPHLSSDIYAITTKNNKKIVSWDDIDKEGIIVAVSKGTYHVSIMKKKLKNAELVVLNSFKERESAVESSRADVFMTDYPYGKKMIEKTKWAKIIVPKSNYHLTPYAWTMAYGNDKFFNRVEKFIKDIKTDGRLQSLAKQNGLEPIVNKN